MISNCCSAPIIENTDLCSRCKEYCTPDTQSLRMYFFNKEGYMQTDKVCLKYWEEHNE